jgi:hypothetical protein
VRSCRHHDEDAGGERDQRGKPPGDPDHDPHDEKDDQEEDEQLL